MSKKKIVSRRPGRSRIRLHCVIGPTVLPGKNVDRTWLADEKAGVEHAKKLLREKVAKGDTSTKQLLVVRVVRVVEIREVPVTVRKPRKGESFGQPEESSAATLECKNFVVGRGRGHPATWAVQR